ncbi:hypothetical protein AB833_00075 [Chromatiales bacterium (ex Bugula neritina AB1)]|nr:hypothetical protein AB833_00075 [Chromatiales bacterium (ex Bugula neritina AB1)]
MKDFFISYTKADRSWAEWIAWQLEAEGYSVVIQAWDFRQGGNFVLDMQRAVSEAERTIVVLSPAFLASRFTAPEWAAAFASDPTGQNGLLVPVRVKNCRLRGLLAQIVYIDLVGVKNREAAREKLLKGVKKGRAKPLEEPDMPQIAPLMSGGVDSPVSDAAALAQEPPWPPALRFARAVIVQLFWRLLRFAVTAVGIALLISATLRSYLPLFAEKSPDKVQYVALIWGLVTALIIELILRWRRKRLQGE